MYHSLYTTIFCQLWSQKAQLYFFLLAAICTTQQASHSLHSLRRCRPFAKLSANYNWMAVMSESMCTDVSKNSRIVKNIICKWGDKYRYPFWNPLLQGMYMQSHCQFYRPQRIGLDDDLTLRAMEGQKKGATVRRLRGRRRFRSPHRNGSWAQRKLVRNDNDGRNDNGSKR